MFEQTLLTAGNIVGGAREKFEMAKDKFEEAKLKAAKYNLKRLKTIGTVIMVICFVAIAASLAMSIIALVKSCKAERMSAEADEFFFGDEDLDDYDYDMNESQLPDAEISDEEELSF